MRPGSSLLATILLTLNIAAFAQAELEFVQMIKNGTDGVTIKNHVGPVTARGDYVYVAIHYSGLLQYYKRDLTTGRLTYAGEFACDKADASIDSLVWISNRLYFHAGAGHETGDQDSRGLHWLEIDPQSGKPTEKGTIDIPLSAGLVAGPDQKFLYLLAGKQKKVIRFKIGADGKPEKQDEVNFKDATSDVFRLTISPDGKALYAMYGDREFALGCIELKADGSMAYKGAYSLARLTEGVEWPAGKWGYGWGRGFTFSPDGLNVYADFCNYGGKDFRLAMLSRDPNTNELIFKERIESKSGPSMVRLESAFEPDGTVGYFASGTECAGNVVGWFTRDSKSGAVTFGGTVAETQRTGPSCIYLDSENGYVYVGTWAGQQLFVLRTAKSKHRATGAH